MKSDSALPRGEPLLGSAARRSASAADAPRYTLLRAPRVKPDLIVIGASTGGPPALVSLLTPLAPAIRNLPACVTLHMPSDLMPVVASHIAAKCRVRTEVVLAPTVLRAGTVYFSPGHQHMEFQRNRNEVMITLKPAAPKDFCKPAIDVMFTAASRVHPGRVLGVVLSGMGKDGLQGSQTIVAAGGSVIVQDKPSSAVWGMPGAVAEAGLASAVLTPNLLAVEILRRLIYSSVAA